MKNPVVWFFDLVERSRFGRYAQFLRFAFVGVLNTLIQYGIEQLCYYVVFRDASFAALGGETAKVWTVTAIGFVVSVTHAYFWNSRFVFREPGSLRKYLRSAASYALTGLVLSPLIKRAAQGFGLPFWAASLVSLLVTVPLNFVLNKFWAFRRKKRGAPTEDANDHL